MNILVVDDDPKNTYQLEVLLKFHGHTVQSACNGEDALAHARRLPPDLVVSDVMMPVMDGFTFCRAWKMDERLRLIPFVFYTATYADDHDQELAMSLGADRFLLKPLEPDVFIANINEAVKNPKPLPGELGVEELSYLRRYSYVLVRKLEQKITQLEETKGTLEVRVQERTQELNKANDSLKQRLADLELTNKRLESFSYTVSHDLRAPLRIMAGYVGIILNDYGQRLDAEGLKALMTVLDATKRMNQLIDDLLGLSTAKRLTVKRERMNICALARALMDEMRAVNTRYFQFVCPSAEQFVEADPMLMRIALENLFSNAIKFTSKCNGDARIEFGWMPGSVPPVFFVSDNGAGFNPKHKERLFEAFQRLHSTAEFPGTGVGLVTVRQVIEQHGGRVWAEGEVGKGACFYFTIPTAPAVGVSSKRP